MERVTITIDDDLLASIDQMMKQRGYTARSEVFRDLLRRGLAEEQPRQSPKTSCVAVLSFVAEQTVRDLPQRIAAFQREHHDLVVSHMQVQLDHESALHTATLRGPVAAIRHATDGLLTQRGIRHGRVTIIPSREEVARHSHGHGTHSHVHVVT